jgi:hypothetical protein
MQPQVYSVTGTGSSDPFVVNTNTTPVNIGIAVVVSGTVNYTVQHTYDSPGGSQPYNPQAGFTTWFDDATLAAQSTTKQTNILYPVTGVRLVVNSGNGTATMTVVQAGIA